MANLVLDGGGRPAPQYLNEKGTEFEYSKGKDGSIFVSLNNIDPIEATSATSKMVLPVQMIDKTGKAIDLSSLTKSKEVRKIITSGLKNGKVESAEVVVNNSNKVSVYVVSTSINSISDISILGLLDDTYCTIDKCENINPIDNTIAYTINNIPPIKIKVAVTSTENIDYTVYMVVA